MIDQVSEQRTKLDGVYVDSVNGVPGTSWPIGTPEMPVSNLTDAFLISTARKLYDIYISGDVTLGADIPLTPFHFIGRSRYQPYSTIDLDGHNAFQSAFTNMSVFNFGVGGGEFTSADGCWIGTWLNGGIAARYLSECIIEDNFIRRYNTIFVKCVFSNDPPSSIVANIGAGAIYLINCSGYLTIDNLTGGAGILIEGNQLVLTINASCVMSTIDVYGDVKIINNSGGTVVNDYTNKPKSEVPVNITAIAANETNFLNLATAGFHYTIDDLVLKCADPGANTVSVRLYKLENGGSVLTHTFLIVTGAVALTRGVTGGFALHFGLDDMFTRTQLAGDNIKITVQAAGGAGSIVIGSYSYRSA